MRRRLAVLIGAVSVALVLTSVAVAGSTGVAGRGSGARGMSPRSRGGVKAGTGGSPRGSSQVRLAQLVHLRDRMAVVEAARRRWLASAPVRAARVASWTQFHGLSSSAAQALTASDFRGAFGAMGRSPATSVAEAGRVMRYLGDFRAIVVDRHGRQLLATSTVPLRTSAGPVDLRLIANRRGFSPARSAETLSIGHELDAGVSIGSGVRLVLEGADSSGRFSAQNSVFIPMSRGTPTLPLLRRRVALTCRPCCVLALARRCCDIGCRSLEGRVYAWSPATSSSPGDLVRCSRFAPHRPWMRRAPLFPFR